MVRLWAGKDQSIRLYFFYKRDFELPCFDQCGRSYNDANTFCLNLDLYADNSIFEIYVNGIPQSPNLGGVIPLSNPFNPVNHTENDKTSVSLCKDWKSGSNTLIIVLASSATVAGIEVEASLNPPPPPDADTAAANICSGETYNFGNLQLTKSGYYFQTFSRSSGCTAPANNATRAGKLFSNAGSGGAETCDLVHSQGTRPQPPLLSAAKHKRAGRGTGALAHVERANAFGPIHLMRADRQIIDGGSR